MSNEIIKNPTSNEVTEPIDVLVEKSLMKTADIQSLTTPEAPKIQNTQTIEAVVEKSLCRSSDKKCFLNGGTTKTVALTIGGDNTVYANAKLSKEENALFSKEDGLYVRPEKWTAQHDENMELAVDNAAQTVRAAILNSPRLNNKYENELIVAAAENYTESGNIKNTFDTKVDKVVGKALSTCDYTPEEQTKLAQIDTSQYIKLLEYDNTNCKLMFRTDAEALEIPFAGLLNGVSYDGTLGRLTFNVSNGNAVNIDLPKDNFVMNGVYDATREAIILTLSNGNEILIPVSSIVSIIHGTSNSNIDVSVDSEFNISATLKISSDNGNSIIGKPNGIYAPFVDRYTLNISNVDNTADINKIVSAPQKAYIDESVGDLRTYLNTGFSKKENTGDVNFKTTDGKIVFFVGGKAQMEISSEGVNFLV